MSSVSTWLPGVLVALIGIVPGVLAWRQATRARDEMQAQERATESLDHRKVDQAAFEAARSIYEAGLIEAQRQLTQRLEQILILERESARHQRRIDALEAAMRQAAMPVPPKEAEPG